MFSFSNNSTKAYSIGSKAFFLLLGLYFQIVPFSKEKMSRPGKNLAKFEVNYRHSETKSPNTISYTALANYVAFKELDSSLQFATAVTMYGLKLRESIFFPEVSWDIIKQIAMTAHSPNNYLHTEFIELVEKSKLIYTDKRKKRKKN